jgi:two-component system phosphate regulon sensor histidine kinase PhoR
MNESPERQSPIVYRLPREKARQPAAVDPRREKDSRDATLLRENIVWFCQLRWIVVMFLLSGAIIAYFPSLLASLGLAMHIEWLLATAGALIVANVVYIARTPPESGDLDPRPLRAMLWVQILVDLIVLTVVVHFVGSVRSYAPFMYLFHMILACIFFSQTESLIVTIAAAALYGLCLALEGADIISPTTVFVEVGSFERAQLSPRFWVWHITSLVVIWGFIWYLTSRLAGALREREIRLALANRQLQASTDERAKHMLQTTHQLKAPFSAIHANTQLLLGGFCGELPEKAVLTAEKISARCHMMSQQITEMLQLANLRSQGQAAPPVVDVDLADLLRVSIARVEPTAARRGIEFDTDIEDVSVRAIDDHVRMLIDNVMSNSVNYSHDGGVVEVSCKVVGDAAMVRIRDAGIGISAEKLPRIFDDYYRTQEAARHNKASTGLGLAIVRDAARAGNIEVLVESGPGWGTRFTITIPKNEIKQSPVPPGQEGS